MIIAIGNEQGIVTEAAVSAWLEGNRSFANAFGKVEHLAIRMSDCDGGDKTRAPVLIVEGEKDADNLLAAGFAATTNSGGAGKWTADLNRYFEGRDIYILPDNDDVGADHARQVAAALQGVARSIRIINLPGLPPKGDVTDWLEAGGTANDLADLMRQAPEQRAKGPRFVFESVSDLRAMPPQEYLVESWIPERSVGLLYGKWGSGKTFLGFDWALHLVFGMPDWHGARLPGEPCDVLIIAREGHAGFVKRISAFMAHHRLEEDPKNLVFMRSPISFLDDVGFAELKSAIAALGRPFRFVLVDTVGRVLPGADMAKEQPITLFMERLQQIGEITGGTTLGVHHENKSGDANGSMYFQNNSDFMFNTSREGEGALTRGKITCAKQKEGDDLWSREITFAKVDLPDGKSSLVVESVLENDRSNASGRSSATPRQGRALDALDEVVLSHGEPAPFDIKGVTAVAGDRWRDELFARGILDRAAKNPRTDFKRIKDQLANKFLIGERDGLVWRAK